MSDRLDSRIRAFVVELVDDPPEAPPFPHSDVVVIRGDRSHRRRAMETTPTTTEPRTPWWRGPRVALAVTAAIVVVAVATFAIASLIDSDEPDVGAAGPVTIETEIDFSGSTPHGTFKVTVGADVLGCSSGTFVDMPGTPDKTNKVMTCESGSNAGTFTILFDPPGGLDWSVLESSDDFAGLQGGGDFSWALDQDTPSGEETLTGDIEYTS